jgi:CubicO group peptidase (beta-lactamase class C family)
MKIFATRLLLLTLSIALGWSSDSYGQSDQAEASISAIMQETPVAGLSVAVVKGNRVIYAHSFGYKDLEHRIPLTNDNIFRIASISKSFSATSIMQLAENGKLSLDDDVGDLLGFPVRNPKFPGTIITLRMLLSHRSSINDSQGYFSLDSIDPSKNADGSKCYNDYEPGKGYQYCNLNYNLTGAIIEKISGERFDQYVKKHITDPLGLKAGYCVDSLDASSFAKIYEYRADSSKFIHAPAAYAPRSAEIAAYVMGRSTPVFSPTGGMKISAVDLARYMVMHSRMGRFEGGRIISKKSAGMMRTVLSEKEGYGLALLTTDKLISGERMLGHTGSAYGLYSAMFWHPKKKFGFIVISNGCHPGYSEGFNTVIRKTVNGLYDVFIR